MSRAIRLPLACGAGIFLGAYLFTGNHSALFTAGVFALALLLELRFRPRRHLSHPPRVARAVEALTVLVLGSTVLFQAATTAHSGGLLLQLNEVSLATAYSSVALAVAALIFIACAAAATYTGATRLGVAIAVGALALYGLAINGPYNVIRASRNTGEAWSSVDLKLTLIGVNIPRGAQLSVNGVHLGELPVEITLDDFLSRVPKEPKGTTQERVWISEQSLGDGRTGAYTNCEFRLTLPTKYWRGAEVAPQYYATVSYGGEEALAADGAGRSGSGSGNHYESLTSLEFIFPARTLRLQALLNQARLVDYKVTPAWLEALETYDADAFLALRRLAQTNETWDLKGRTMVDGWRPAEPEFLDVLKAWAAWRYGLGHTGFFGWRHRAHRLVHRAAGVPRRSQGTGW